MELTLTAENKVLRDRVNEIDAYKRRWNLKISGVLERESKKVKITVIELLSRVSPGIKDSLQSFVDVACWIGPSNDKGGRSGSNTQYSFCHAHIVIVTGQMPNTLRF